MEMSNCLAASLQGEHWHCTAHISWIMRGVSELCNHCLLGQKFHISGFIRADQCHKDTLSWLPLFLVALVVKLGHLFDVSLVSWGKLVLLWTFPLGTAFTESHRFWVVMFSFSFISMHILISFLISSVICWLFSLHMLEFLIVFLL